MPGVALLADSPSVAPPTVLLGEACALGSAITWAFALVLFKRSGDTYRPIHLNLFKNVIALLLLLATLPLAGEGFGVVATLPARDVWILLASGFIGIAVADSLVFWSLRLMGVGLLSIVECAYAPSVLLWAGLLLADPITGWDWLGVALIAGAVLISSRHPAPPGRTPAQITLGMLVGVAAMGSMGFGIVIAASVLDGTPVITATTLRLVAGTFPLLALAAALPDRGRLVAVFTPSATWRQAIPAAVLGSYLAMMMWVGGYKYAPAAINAILNQTSVIFSLILATLILGEPLTRRKVTSITLAFVGVLLVKLTG